MVASLRHVTTILIVDTMKSVSQSKGKEDVWTLVATANAEQTLDV
jgi:hypothetical protein